MRDEARYHLQKVSIRYRLTRVAESFLLGASTLLIVYALFNLVDILSQYKIVVACTAGLVVFTWRIFYLRIFKFTEGELVSFLNNHYAALQQSFDLVLIADEQLTTLQQIQKDRSVKNFEAIRPNLKLPNQMLAAALLFVGCAAVFVVLEYFNFSKVKSPPFIHEKGKSSDPSNIFDAKNGVENVMVKITPPVYTGLNSSETTTLDLNVPEGSSVTWTIKFARPVQSGGIVLSGNDTLKIGSNGKSEYSASTTFNSNGFYQLLWSDHQQKSNTSDFHKVLVTPDESPRIKIRSPSQFTSLAFKKGLSVDIDAGISDDYGLKDAVIIATVSKGSGESVKFREVKMAFDKPALISGKTVAGRKNIAFEKLGMEPGDELYWYIVATDNKIPTPNSTRTETYFIAIQDTVKAEVVFDTGMGVDLMPEYFRSQRQIIIDSEKLLEEQKQKKVSQANFNVRSNELGYDQKVLRLRYGQFMGDESEAPAPQAETENKREDVTVKYGHVHDTQNEHNLVGEKKPEHETKAGSQKNAAADAAGHEDGETDESTFLEQSIKTKLRLALNMMWDAELHLRLNRPAQSLPFQYRILKLLKEISNDSRVYVRRTGFDPPPLKEDKRLKGDLDEIRNSSTHGVTEVNVSFQAIRRALPVLENLLQKNNIDLSQAEKTILQKAGNELATAAVEHPEIYLDDLSRLKTLINGEIPAADESAILHRIRATFWKMLPAEDGSPNGKFGTAHSLDDSFIKNLNGDE